MNSIYDINFENLTDRGYYPSPVAWEDHVLYFLMLDRFSNNKENGYLNNEGLIVKTGSTPPFSEADSGNNPNHEFHGHGWQGGTLKGLESKIGYLKRLGVTAIWISPIFKQFKAFETYHGYGIQNFMEIDENFGTKEDLISLVNTAHNNGIYMILDIIFNHCGDVFGYIKDRVHHPKWDGDEYNIKGYRDLQGNANIPFGPISSQDHPNIYNDIGVYPIELQKESSFTKKGNISNWNYRPEYIEGDFCGLKDINLGDFDSIDDYTPTKALQILCEVYKYWIALSDIDGFRIDTVKHMSKGAVRYFSQVIKEFTESIGKNNFYLIGEITGGREYAVNTMELTGLNAALGINDIPQKIEHVSKGNINPIEYFELFRNSELINKNSHSWLKNKVVTVLDDHDQVSKGKAKARFCTDKLGKSMIIPVLGLNALTLGIPCIYYGTEQGFDGHYYDSKVEGNDRFLRENMFGGNFGSFSTKDRHFFIENEIIYKELAKILQVRKDKIQLRRGRQYLREVSGDGYNFSLPYKIGDKLNYIIPWSRISNNIEIIVAINTDPGSHHKTWVTVDNFGLHKTGESFKIIYSTDKSQIGKTYTITDKNGKSIELNVPKAGLVILDKL